MFRLIEFAKSRWDAIVGFMLSARRKSEIAPSLVAPPITPAEPLARMDDGAPANGVSIQEPPKGAAPSLQPKPKSRGETADDGAFFHVGDLLDQIPRARGLLRSLKKIDRDAYDYHHTIGARLVPHKTLAATGSISRTFLDLRPTAGMIYFGGTETKETLPAAFAYFQKYSHLPGVQFVPEAVTIYRVSIAWVSKEVPMVGQFAIGLSRDNSVRLLLERQTISHKMRARRNGRRKAADWTLQRQEWAIPSWLHGWARDTNERAEDKAITVFRLCANFYDHSNDGFQIRAERDGISMAFGVSLGRTPQFFKNRDLEVGAHGQRKRIFHSVAAHTRTLRDGRQVDVSPHYRGLRRFTWRGENITITAPEFAARRINVSAIDADEAGMTDVMLTASDAAMRVRGFLETSQSRPSRPH
jgi:hypothetical protein